jgi:hypothetical protein
MKLLDRQVLNTGAFGGLDVHHHPRAAARHAHIAPPRCAAQAAVPAAESLQPKNMVLVKAVELLFSVKPIFALASAAVGVVACDCGCVVVYSDDDVQPAFL